MPESLSASKYLRGRREEGRERGVGGERGGGGREREMRRYPIYISIDNDDDDDDDDRNNPAICSIPKHIATHSPGSS